MIRLKTPRREQTKPENSNFFRTKHDPAMFWESALRILAFARSRKHRCTPLNLTLLPPSPYRLIIEQIEVDLINLEDEVETFNSLLPIVAASLYRLFLMTDSDLTYDGINPVYRREKRKRRTCVTVKMTERPKLSEVSPNYPMFAVSLYRRIS